MLDYFLYDLDGARSLISAREKGAEMFSIEWYISSTRKKEVDTFN